MTSEEAIDILKDLWRFQKSERYTETQIRDALELAIDALHENESLAKSVIEASELLRKQRPHGKWLVLYECPNCGEIRNTPFEVCPQCKMNMRGGDK